MRIYFSGGKGLVNTPEVLVPEVHPFVMLTFYAIKKREKETMVRVKSFLKQKKK